MLGLFEAPAPGHDDLGGVEGDALLDFRYGADKAATRRLPQDGQVHRDHFPGGSGRRGQGLKDAGPGRGHLGVGAGSDDGGHDVAAEGRAGLEQEALVRVDGKGGAVRGEAGFQGRGHLGDKSPAQVGGSGQDDFRLKFPGQLG